MLLMWIYFASGVLLYAASCARVLAEQKGDFNRAVEPPPAAAVTAASSGSNASTAVVAAELAVDQSGARHRGSERRLRPVGRQSPHRGLASITSIVAMAVAGYVLAKRSEDPSDG